MKIILADMLCSLQSFGYVYFLQTTNLFKWKESWALPMLFSDLPLGCEAEGKR